MGVNLNQSTQTAGEGSVAGESRRLRSGQSYLPALQETHEANCAVGCSVLLENLTENFVAAKPGECFHHCCDSGQQRLSGCWVSHLQQSRPRPMNLGLR